MSIDNCKPKACFTRPIRSSGQYSQGRGERRANFGQVLALGQAHRVRGQLWGELLSCVICTSANQSRRLPRIGTPGITGRRRGGAASSPGRPFTKEAWCFTIACACSPTRPAAPSSGAIKANGVSPPLAYRASTGTFYTTFAAIWAEFLSEPTKTATE